MPPEQQRAAADGDGADDISMVTVPGTMDGTRSAIDQIIAMVEDMAVRSEDLHALEIALAEVFNNIVEHAYADRDDGVIEVILEAREPGLHLEIWDDGAPMPAGRLPGGAPADTSLEAHEQAEGGYGLFLIRQLARKLRYERTEGRNRLSFRVVLNPF